MFDPLVEAHACYATALTFSHVGAVSTYTRRGFNLLAPCGAEADALRLSLLDLELQMMFASSYLPPPAANIERFVQLAARADIPRYKGRAQHYQGVLAWTVNSFTVGLEQVRAAMEALIACADLEGQYYTASSLGLFLSVNGQLERGVGLMRASLTLYDQIDPAQRDLPVMRLNRARLIVRLAMNLFDLDYFEEALEQLAIARSIYVEAGHPFGASTEYAQLYARVGDWAQAEHWAKLGMESDAQESDQAYARTLYGFILGQQNQIEAGIAQLEQSLATVTRIGLEGWQRALASVYLADLLLADSPAYDPERADKLNDAAFAIGETASVHYGSIYALVNKTRIALAAGDPAQAVQFAVEAANRVRARDTLTLVREEQVLYWEYCALQAVGQDGWPSLADAHRRLMIAAERIKSPAMRQSFLEAVPLHRLIKALYCDQTAA